LRGFGEPALQILQFGFVGTDRKARKARSRS
jgi:hypothetical protein